MAQSVCTSYSIPTQASCVVPLHQFQPDIHSFLIGTNSLSEKNRIYQLEYAEGNNHLSERYVFNHPNEILHMATNPTHPDKIITVSRPVEGHIDDCHVGVLWQLPTPKDDDDHNNLKLIKLGQFQDVSQTFPLPLSYTALSTPNQSNTTAPTTIRNVNLPDYGTNFLNPFATSPNPNQWGDYLSSQLGLDQPYPTPRVRLNAVKGQEAMISPLRRVIWQSHANPSAATTNTTTNTTTSTMSTSSTIANGGTHGSGGRNATATALAVAAATGSDPTIAPETSQLATKDGIGGGGSSGGIGGPSGSHNFCLTQYDHGVGLCDLNIIDNGIIKHVSSTKQQFNSQIQHVCWNRHKIGELFYTATTHHIHGIDIRTMKDSFVIPFPHGDARVSGLDSNFIRNYTILTTGDDGVVSVWDIRRPTTPLLSARLFTHAVSCCEYNVYHDNLVFAAGLDTTVGLFSFASVGSIPSAVQGSSSSGPGSSVMGSGIPGLGGVGGRSVGGAGVGGGVGGGKERTQLDATQLFPRIEPPYSYGGNSSSNQDNNKRKQRDGGDEDAGQMTMAEAFDREEYQPQQYAIAPANRAFSAASFAPGAKFDSNLNNGGSAVGDCLMSYHREHLTSVVGGCWSASSPWHYATLSSDGTFILNMVTPESQQYNILL